tara:strand:+ start:323 stop:970 length:648 start_codon:yes stop_codon:yes gene_type:complete
MSASNYLKITDKYKKNFSKQFIIKNYGSFIGDRSFYKLLICLELLEKTKKVKGDVIEFGIWNGNNLLTMKKILDYFQQKKKLIGYDHFKGMPKNLQKNNFRGDIDLINYFVKFFKLKKISIINDDIMNLNKYLKSFKKFSFIYIDCDIYKTTKIILENLSKKLSRGGLIVFDEGNQRKQSGETKAMKEFFEKNKKNYKKFYLKKGYQPDVYLKKI